MILSESSVITYNYVVKALRTTLKYKLDDHVLLDKCIHEVLKTNKGNNFGSYRGYYTFLHTEFKNNVIEKYKYYTHKPLKLL